MATILSVAMMFRYSLDQGAIADAIEAAVARVLQEGYRTADIYSDNSQQQVSNGRKKGVTLLPDGDDKRWQPAQQMGL